MNSNMEYQNMIHRTTTPGSTLFTAPDGKVFRLFSYNGNTVVTPSGARLPQPHINHLQPPSHSSQTLASIITGGPMSPMAANGPMAHPKQPKGPPGQPRPMSRGNSEQTDKLMSLLMYKDGQIAALTTRVDSLRATLESQGMQDKKAAQGMKELQSGVEEKQRENDRLAQELANVRAGKKKVVAEKIKLEKHLNGKFSEMNVKIGKLEEEVETLRKAKVEIWDEKRDLMQRLETSEAKCRSDSESLANTSKSLSEAKAMAQRVDQEKKRLDSEKRRLEKSKEEAFQTVQVLKKVVQQKESRIDLLQGKMKNMARESKKGAAEVTCNCSKTHDKEIKQQLQEKEESEARMGDMLAKMKSQIACLTMEKEKARTQMITAWESEANLRTDLEQEKAAKVELEKQLEQQSGSSTDKKAAGESSEKAVRLGLYRAKNAKLKERVADLEQKLTLAGEGTREIPEEDKEERCKKLYKDLIRYKVSPAKCRKVAQCVLKNLLDRTEELPGKEFAWSTQQESPPTPHVSDEEEARSGSEHDDAEEEVVTLSDGEEDDRDNESSDTLADPDKRKADLTKRLDHFGGLWCTPSEMQDQLESLDESVHEEAVVVQLQYRSVVLELAREGKLLHSSVTGQRKPFPELKSCLLRLIKRNEHQEGFMKEVSRREAIVEEELMEEDQVQRADVPDERKRMYSPGPDHPILRPRKRHSSRRSGRKIPFGKLHGKMVEHFVEDGEGSRGWHKGVVVDQARSSLSILYEFAADSPRKISLREARDDFDKGDLVACEVTLEDFLGKVVENLWEMDEGVTEWYKGHVLKMVLPQGEDTEFEVAYGGTSEDDFYYVPLLKDYWCHEVRMKSLS